MLIALIYSFVGACSQVHHTLPKRSATELYLLSHASESAVDSLTAEGLRGRTIFVDDKYASHEDHAFIVAATRAKLLHFGARLASEREDAEIIVELRTPGVSIDRSEFLIGLPGFPLGTAAVAAGAPPTDYTTPELAIIKSDKQWGTAGIAYVAYWRESGQVIESSGPHIGRSYREDWTIFGYGKRISDIAPAKRPEYHEAEEHEIAEPDVENDDAEEPKAE